MEKLYILEINN